MWRKVPKEQEPHLLKVAIEFTGNHTEYGKAMLEVAKKWRYSCENFQKNLVTARIECYEDINLMLTTSAIYADMGNV